MKVLRKEYERLRETAKARREWIGKDSNGESETEIVRRERNIRKCEINRKARNRENENGEIKWERTIKRASESERERVKERKRESER